MKYTLAIFSLTLIATVAAPAAPANRPMDDRRDRRDGPSFGVARVSVADGDVRVQRGEDEMQLQSSMAVTPGDAVLTGRDSRLELQLDLANFLRLDEDSAVRISDLGNRAFRVEVQRGAVVYSEYAGGDADVAIETEHASVQPLKDGVYRVEYLETGQTTVTIRDGAANVDTGRRVEKIKDGKSLILRGAPADPNFQMAKAEPKDSFDDWNKRRDKILDRDGGRTWVVPYLGVGWGWGRGYPGYWGPGWGPGYYGGRSRTVFVGGAIGRRHAAPRGRRR